MIKSECVSVNPLDGVIFAMLLKVLDDTNRFYGYI